jgi:hypothetical protein
LADIPAARACPLLGHLEKLQSFGESNFYELMDGAVSKSQDILKAEWRRVKKGQ